MREVEIDFFAWRRDCLRCAARPGCQGRGEGAECRRRRAAAQHALATQMRPLCKEGEVVKIRRGSHLTLLYFIDGNREGQARRRGAREGAQWRRPTPAPPREAHTHRDQPHAKGAASNMNKIRLLTDTTRTRRRSGRRQIERQRWTRRRRRCVARGKRRARPSHTQRNNKYRRIHRFNSRKELYIFSEPRLYFLLQGVTRR